MSIQNKTFKNNRTGELVKVLDSFENIVILENRDKIDISKLMNPDLFTEQIDPSSFFNNQLAYDFLAEKIKSIPADKIVDNDSGEIMVNLGDSSIKVDNESAVVMMTEDDERAEIAKKYGIENNYVDAVSKQNEAFAKLLDDDYEELPIPNQQPPTYNQNQTRSDQQDRPQYTQQVQEDPIISMFKNVKRTNPFSVTLDIENKIPRLDFIEMMEDSYQTSIIDFLATEFTDNLLRNPHIIENMIKDKIRSMVYHEKPKKSSRTTKKVVKEEVQKIEAPLEKPKRTYNKKIKEV